MGENGNECPFDDLPEASCRLAKGQIRDGLIALRHNELQKQV